MQSTIAALSPIADKAVISRLYKSTMQKLLKVTLEAAKVRDSRKPNSMGSADSSNESSPSVLRSVLHFTLVHVIFYSLCLVASV